MNTHPEHDPEGAQRIYEKGIACDHHFGDDGSSAVCTKCGMDRDTAERVGRTQHKRLKHLKTQLGPR